ncbi:LCP family glycopolymer transferase CpsA [Streptococcus pluranimalium]|uniref:LCP family glycopolymer transferase CpsA n=1 Tax=Streptococcus pluranimalium TaxID=82348 RepID=UPI002A7E8FE9|nr:LCP family protein [Streptococcus pluranimalium]HEM6115527.1 LCP family protein [Streptococcus suis]
MSKHHRSKKRGTQTKKRYWQVADGFLIALFTIIATLTTYLVMSHHVLNVKGLNWLMVIAFVLILAVATFFVLSKKLLKTIAVLLVVFSLLTGAFLYLTKTTLDATKRINESSFYSQVDMSVVVHKDSAIKNLSDVTTLEAPTTSDKSNVEALLKQIKMDKGIEPSVQKVDSYQSAYAAIKGDTNKAMVMNSAYVSLLEQEDDSFRDNVRTLYTYTVRKEAEKQLKPKNEDVLNLYVSGIDTYGPINNVSRSDVNIIMTINLKTKKVLLTTTPRDSYVKIPDGGANQYDKLTHAGIYGVETSEKTLENLYDIDIDYYARINFNSFMNLIDVLGGVDVINDQAFTSRHGNFDFPVGKVTLTSEKALGFVRERYSLAGGDNDRGKNQEKVIAAIINKLSSINTITKFSSVLDGVSNSVQTNMPSEMMMAIANKQIESGGHYTVISQDVTGKGSTGELPSYAMPNSQLYMYSLDDTSVSTAKTAIQEVMEGK